LNQNLDYPIWGEGIALDNIKYYALDCRDFHGLRSEEEGSRKSRYFRSGEESLPGPRLGKWEYTVMNPDPYAFINLLWRLRDKQWEPFLDGDAIKV
jgi:hypothetical protein